MLLKRLLKFYFLLFFLLTKSSNIVQNVQYVKLAYYNEVIPKDSNNITLKVPKINLDVYTSYDSTLQDGLQIHDMSTKPGNNGSTLIIMGHAGIGQNVYFNNINRLQPNDLIKIEYGNMEYKYLIESKEIISKGNKYPFEFKQNFLYLVTCYHHNKQIIIKAKMTKI